MLKCWVPAALSLVLMTDFTYAQTAGDKATAEALFGSGRKLMAAGNYAEACPKLAASQKLDPGVGTMLNLADCYEKTGQTASAWALFRETISAARTANSKEREQLARDRAQALEPKLSRITITTVPGQAATLRILRDGVVVDSAALGTALPVDPGKHVVEATAPGKKKWSRSLDVAAGGAQVTVAIPSLLSDDPTSTSLLNTTAGSSQTPPDSSEPKRSGGAQRGAAIGLGAVGVVGVVVGSAFGLKAKSDWSQAKSSCATFPYQCTNEAVGQGSDAKSAAGLATAAFIIGGVGLLGGAVLWLTAPNGNAELKGGAERRLALTVGPSSVALTGAF